jgi:cytochrome c556
MKKVILALALTSVATFASDKTIDATMQLMKQGMEQVQKGFMYNSKSDIIQGIETIENSNSIFKNVDVTTFIPKNHKVRVTQNITHNLESNLKRLKKDVKAGKFADATAGYGKVLNNCVACHTSIRGW